MKVAVIGAGATGLAAAYDLVKRGYRVTVFERTDFLGGQASTFDVGGARLERGYHHLFTGDRAILDLMEEIGLRDQIRRIESRVGTLYDGKIYDFVTPLDLLRFKPLSLIDRIRLGLMTLRLRRMKNWQPLEVYTADQWLREHAGKKSYDVFWGPMLRGKFGEDYFDQAGMAWLWGKVHTRFASRDNSFGREKLIYPNGSFGEVFDVLAQKIRSYEGDLRLCTEVLRIIVENGRAVAVEVKTRGSHPVTEGFDAVLATTQSHIFSRLVPELPEEYRSRLDTTRYMAAVLLILVLDRPLSHVYWLNVADRSIPFVGVIEHTNLIEPSHYGGRHIIYLSNYLTREHAIYNMNHQDLLKTYMPHLRKINPAFERSWILESYHHQVDAAQPIIGVNYSEQMPDMRTPISCLYLSNTTQIYPEDRGTNFSVVMGQHVARMVMTDLEQGQNIFNSRPTD